MAFYHHRIKRTKRDVFNAVLREMIVLRPPSAMPKSPFKRPRLNLGPSTERNNKGKTTDDAFFPCACVHSPYFIVSYLPCSNYSYAPNVFISTAVICTSIHVYWNGLYHACKQGFCRRSSAPTLVCVCSGVRLIDCSYCSFFPQLEVPATLDPSGTSNSTETSGLYVII